MTSQRIISARVSATEYEAVCQLAAASEKTVSSWLRDLMINATATTTKEEIENILLGEILAMRSISITLLYKIATRAAITEGTVREIIKLADTDKALRAANQLRK
jgi:hypothetical protein